MREEKVKFKAYDGKDIFCAVHYVGSDEKKADKAVVLIHGVTGSPYFYVLQILSRYFASRGYDVYRPALHWSESNNRNLSECTMSLHTQDIQAVVDVLRLRYNKFYVGGYSLAGALLRGLKHTANAYSFIDSDYSSWDDTWSRAKYNEKLDAYFIGRDMDVLVSKDMVEQSKHTTISEIESSFLQLNVPSQVVVAEFGQVGSGQKIFSMLRGQKDYKYVENAGHTFVENNSADRLAELIFQWFERF